MGLSFMGAIIPPAQENAFLAFLQSKGSCLPSEYSADFHIHIIETLDLLVLPANDSKVPGPAG